MQVCSRCGASKDDAEYYPNVKACKLCISKAGEIYREKHKIEIKKYREKHREERKKSKKRYQDAHREENATRAKLYALSHPETIKKKDERYRKENKNKIKERRMKYYKHHPEAYAKTYFYSALGLTVDKIPQEALALKTVIIAHKRELKKLREEMK